MSEDIYAMPDLSKKVRFQTGEEADGNADVSKITDNVNIYDNYLPQGSSPLELQDSTTEDPQKGTNLSVCLCLSRPFYLQCVDAFCFSIIDLKTGLIFIHG